MSLSLIGSDAEVLWDRLTVKADDFGRYDARPAVIRGACFPLMTRYWTEARITASLAELHEARLIVLYESVGRLCLYFPTWAIYQRVRATASKYPDPPALACDRTQPRADAGSYARVVHVGVGLSSKASKALGSKDLESQFVAFWDSYPRHAGIRAARAAFGKALERASAGEITAAAQRYASDPNRAQEFTPHPATWLNQDRWTDDPLPTRGGTPSGQRPASYAEDLAERLARGSEAMHGGNAEGEG